MWWRGEAGGGAPGQKKRKTNGDACFVILPAPWWRFLLLFLVFFPSFPLSSSPFGVACECAWCVTQLKRSLSLLGPAEQLEGASFARSFISLAMRLLAAMAVEVQGGGRGEGKGGVSVCS